MTGETDIDVDPSAIVLIDNYEDGTIEERAWVQMTTQIETPARALRTLEAAFPADEHGEDAVYVCKGAVEWMKPPPIDTEAGWEAAEQGDEGAVGFWCIALEQVF